MSNAALRYGSPRHAQYLSSAILSQEHNISPAENLLLSQPFSNPNVSTFMPDRSRSYCNARYSAVNSWNNTHLDANIYSPKAPDYYGQLIQSETGLVGYWRMNDVPTVRITQPIPERSRTDAFDSSGYADTAANHVDNSSNYAVFTGNDQDYYNQVSPAFGDLRAIVGDQYSSSGNFSSGYLIVKNQSQLSTGDTFSVEFWLSDAFSGNNECIISWQDSGSYRITLNSDQTISLKQNPSAVIATSTVTINPPDGQHLLWNHVVVTKSGSSVHIYINGIDVTGSVSNQTITNGTSDAFIGTSDTNFDPSTENFQGWLSELAVYNVALSSSQVASHYSSGISAYITAQLTENNVNISELRKSLDKRKSDIALRSQSDQNISTLQCIFIASNLLYQHTELPPQITVKNINASAVALRSQSDQNISGFIIIFPTTNILTQTTDLPPKGTAPRNIAIRTQSDISFITLQSVYEAPAQVYDNPVLSNKSRTYLEQQQANNLPLNTVVAAPFVPQVSQDIFPRKNKLTETHISQTPQSFVSVIGKEVTDNPSSGYSRSLQYWINQTPQTFVSVPGKETFDLAPKEYRRSVQDWSIQFQNYILTSASVPNGKSIYDTLGFDENRDNRYRIAVISQNSANSVPINVLTTPAPPNGKTTYDLAPRGYTRPVQDHVCQTLQAFVSVIGQHVYDDPVVPIRRYTQDHNVLSQNYILTSPSVPDGKSITTDILPGTNDLANRQKRISITSLDVIPSSLALLSEIPAVIPDGKQETELFGYDVNRINRQHIAIRSQSEQLQVQNFVLTSANPPDGKSVYDLAPRGYSRPVSDWTYEIPQSFVSVVGSQIYDLAPKGYRSPVIDWVNQTPQIFVSTVGNQIYDLAPGGYTRPVSDWNYQIPQTFVSVIGQQVYDLAPRGYVRPVSDWIYQIPQSFTNVVGLSSYELPPRGYQRPVQDHYVIVQNNVLLSAGIPEGKQETDLLGYNKLNNNKLTVCDIATNILGSPITITSTVVTAYILSAQRTELYGYDQRRLARYRVAIESQAEILQVQNFVLLSAGIPDGKSSYELPPKGYRRPVQDHTNQTQQIFVRVIGRTVLDLLPPFREKSKAYLEIRPEPVYFIQHEPLPVGNQIFDLAPKGRPPVQQPELVPTRDYIINEAQIKSSFDLPVIGLKSRTYLEIQQQPLLELHEMTLPAGRSSYALPPKSYRRFTQDYTLYVSPIKVPIIGSQIYDNAPRGYAKPVTDFVRSTSQFVLTSGPIPVGVQETDPRRNPVRRFVDADSRGVFITTLTTAGIPDGKQVTDLYGYDTQIIDRLKSFGYTQNTPQSFVGVIGKQFTDNPEFNVLSRQKQKIAALTIDQVPQGFVSVIGKFSTDLPPYRYAPRTYLEIEQQPILATQIVTTPIGEQFTEKLATREISRTYYLDSYNKSFVALLQPLVKSVYDNPIIARRVQQPEQFIVQQFVLTSPSIPVGKSTYDIVRSKPIVTEGFANKYIFARENIPTGSHVYDLPVYRIVNRTISESINRTSQIFSYINSKQITDLPPYRPLRRPYLEITNNISVYRISIIPIGKSSTDPPVRLIRRYTQSQDAINQTSQGFVTVPGKVFTDIPVLSKKIQQPFQTVSLLCTQNVPFIQSAFDIYLKVADRTRAIRSQSEIAQNVKLLVYVPGKSILDLPVLRVKKPQGYTQSTYPWFVQNPGKQFTELPPKGRPPVQQPELLSVYGYRINEPNIQTTINTDLPVRPIHGRIPDFNQISLNLLAIAEKPFSRQSFDYQARIVRIRQDYLQNGIIEQYVGRISAEIPRRRVNLYYVYDACIQSVNINSSNQPVGKLFVSEPVYPIATRPYYISTISQLFASLPYGTIFTLQNNPLIGRYRFGTLFDNIGTSVLVKIQLLIPPLDADLITDGKTSVVIVNDDTEVTLIVNGLTSTTISNDDTEVTLITDGETSTTIDNDDTEVVMI